MYHPKSTRTDLASTDAEQNVQGKHHVRPHRRSILDGQHIDFNFCGNILNAIAEQSIPIRLEQDTRRSPVTTP